MRINIYTREQILRDYLHSKAKHETQQRIITHNLLIKQAWYYNRHDRHNLINSYRILLLLLVFNKNYIESQRLGTNNFRMFMN